MKHPWLAFVIVALLSGGAGVALAGVPDNESVDPTIVVPTTTDVLPTPEPEVTSTTEVPSTTEVTSTTEAAIPDSTTSTSTSVPEVAPLPDRADVSVVTANGSGLAGVAAATAARLEAVGYADVRPRDGTDVVDFTTVYYAEGFEEAASRMAADLDVLAEFIGPLADAPTVVDLPADVELLAYVGLDRA